MLVVVVVVVVWVGLWWSSLVVVVLVAAWWWSYRWLFGWGCRGAGVLIDCFSMATPLAFPLNSFSQLVTKGFFFGFLVGFLPT